MKGTATGQPNKPAMPCGLQISHTVAESGAEKQGESGGVAEGVAMVVNASDIEPLEPKSLAEAKWSPDWLKWKNMIKEELKMLEEAGTWKLVDRPANMNVIGSKWVFKCKRDASGRVVRYKARLVAQGFTQVKGVDYLNTYTPIAKFALLQTILTLSNCMNLKLHQVNIKGAYFNSELTDEECIYMHQPPDFPYTPSGDCVLKLCKTIYSLKQSGHRWYQKFT